MLPKYRAFLAALSMTCGMLSAAAPTYAQAAFSDTTTNASETPMGGRAIVASVIVSEPYTVTSIETPNLVTVANNQRFVIIDTSTDTTVYASPAKAFPADTDAATLKSSDIFPAVTLLPDRVYYIGAIPDQPATFVYRFPASAFTEGVVTNEDASGNIRNFDNPFASGPGAVTAPIRLNTVASVAEVPTMSEWTMILMGLMLASLAVLCVHRCQRTV